MGATTKLNPPRRPTHTRRLAAAVALAALLLLGAMTTAAVAAPRTAPAVHKNVAPAAQPLPTSRPPATLLPLVLGGIVILAVLVPFPGYYPRYGYRGGRY
jgi:hypothetical protein